MAGKPFVFRFGDVEVREREFSLVKAGEVLPVEPKAFRVLLHLLRNPQKLIPKEELLNAVWGETAVSENSLARSIALLRKLLGDEARDPRYIETVATVGYRWVCPVQATEEPSTAAEAPVAPATTQTGQKKAGTRNQLWTWALAGSGVLILCLAGAVWDLHRPLPPPRITEYVQITHDGHPKILAGTDGSRLYFTLFSPFSPRSLAQVAATGGEISQIPVAVPGGDFLAVDVSSDGSSSLIASFEKGTPAFAFWSARLVGGSLRRLGSGVGAAYSPDGRFVAYTTLDGDLWIMASDGTGAHKVGPVGAGGAYMPAWSPDGSAIRFQRDNRIWEIASNGSNLHRLLPGWHDADPQCCGHWTSDGKFFMFVSGELWGNRGQIWALDERRGLLRRPPAEPIQLTLGPTRWGSAISSKDGKKIFAEGTSRHGELSRYDAQTKQFQPYLKGISAEGVAFSKDGQSVAYVSYPEGILWKANRDGSNPVQLSQPPMYPMNPRWSPDGTQILFMDVAPQASRSYIVPADGGSPRQLLTEVDRGMSDPNWSPDGKEIVFASDAPEDPGKNCLRMFDVASGHVTTLPGSVGLFSPRWSPDGRTIAALTWQSTTLEAYDTGKQQWSVLVTKEKDFTELPAFSADSQFVYYLVHGSDEAVYRVRVKGGEPERVVDLKEWHLTGYFDFWMGLDPADAPLLLRDNGTSDIYALSLSER
ncbi:MAG TPA: winged helix-turn-helix domain-containing protein [Terracidiphilus sp.]|jgi:DNA-binding winged helix-turn-helix (wHTH) protein/Tol biopolymer transport system component|nr:winged helix-turn-helix domain-containing protein [Terracidiphilus sp.]